MRDPSKNDNSFTCLCLAEYHGVICQTRKNILQLTVDNTPTPPYIIIRTLGMLEFGSSSNRSASKMLALRIGCKSIEPVLKFSLYMDNGLNACVAAIERDSTKARANVLPDGSSLPCPSSLSCRSFPNSSIEIFLTIGKNNASGVFCNIRRLSLARAPSFSSFILFYHLQPISSP